MKGFLSLLIGSLSFVIIVVSQLNAYLKSMDLLNIEEIVTVHWSIKLISISIALIALAVSINYTRSGRTKMNIPNRVGRYLAILSIILSIIPVYQIFLK